MRKLSMLLVLGLCAAGTAALAADAQALDGKTFVGQICAKGKKTGDAETLTFKDGQFHSLICDQYGFGSAPYTATASGDTVSFTAETHSKSGDITWQGRVAGDEITGTSTFHRKKTWYNFFWPGGTQESDFKVTLQK